MAYWWSRVVTAAVRGAHYALGLGQASWLLLLADDLAMLIPNGRIREAVLPLWTYLRVVGFPLSWKKFAGGETSQWVGHELVLKNAPLGLCSSQHSGCGDGTLLRDEAVQMQELKEGLGRAAFVCGALDYDRPFLSRHVPQSVKPLLLYVLVTLEYVWRKLLPETSLCVWAVTAELGTSLAGGCPCRPKTESEREAGGRKPTSKESSPPGARPGVQRQSHL